MTEHRFRSPDGNEWVALSMPSAEVLASYPAGTVEIPMVPIPDPEPFVPSSVSARQFKLQLLAAGLLDQVNAWVAGQSQAVQIAFEYSGSFVREEPMMQAGFDAMGFTAEQIDAFYLAASEL